MDASKRSANRFALFIHADFGGHGGQLLLHPLLVLFFALSFRHRHALFRQPVVPRYDPAQQILQALGVILRRCLLSSLASSLSGIHAVILPGESSVGDISMSNASFTMYDIHFRSWPPVDCGARNPPPGNCDEILFHPWGESTAASAARFCRSSSAESGDLWPNPQIICFSCNSSSSRRNCFVNLPQLGAFSEERIWFNPSAISGNPVG